MKTLWSFLGMVVVALLCSPCCYAQPESSAGLLIADNTEFAIELYRRVAREDGNIAMSPLSVSVATAMLYAGAAGETEREIAAAAHFTLPQETLHEEFGELLDELGSRVGPRAELSFLNGLWVDHRCALLSGYGDVLREHYGATPDTVDFKGAPDDASRRINRFVSEQTQGKIPSVVDPSLFSALTRVVLVNSVYFLAAWDHGFSESSTRPEPFYLPDGNAVSVDMMHKKEEVRYYQDESVQVLELPYQRSGLSMLLVLPASDSELLDLEARLTPALLSDWVEHLERTGIKMAIPRFEVTQQVDLIPVLSDMGMTSAFIFGSADLSGLCGTSDLFVSHASHHVKLGITEDGTEAAAATVYVAMAGSVSPGEGETLFRADRPFMYIVRDVRRGTILFLGRVTDPASP
ncbi:MAG: serpin family protein [Candidatus Eisenbacteria bacterium]